MGIDEAGRVGFRGTKVNTVVIRGFNDDECEELLEFGRLNGGWRFGSSSTWMSVERRTGAWTKL